MFFAVIARDHLHSTALRAQTKARHRAHLDAARGLRVLQSGPLLDEKGAESGSLLILEADVIDAVQAFMAADPYVQAGLFDRVEIYPWAWRRGNPYLADHAKEQEIMR
ncbi:YciI family protein [Paraburkholderia sp. Cy-641]|uniref:YciI family protein n=1 Tax=Paraburkholderia sp. Cy-641 TaxID=2608337 RepID=UPI00141E2398|nr:YciI family protein [Paraburkholderia sp. Cy-641]NIF77118.1 YciI family protein [Paraburkholderia sp. Cy-641]